MKFFEYSMQMNMAVVVVGYPATNIYEGRVRFCISASHSLQDLKTAIEKIDLIGSELDVKINKRV